MRAKRSKRQSGADQERRQAVSEIETQFIDGFGGARLAVHTIGEGRPLLMLHGNPTWSFLYRELIRGLRDARTAGGMFSASLEEIARDRAGLAPGEER